MSKKSSGKKIEFSKLLVLWSICVTTLCIVVSYILSLLSCDPCPEITATVITTCVAIAVSYEAKSFGEKNSRNKYGIGADGLPVDRGSGSASDTDDEALG